MHRTCSPHRLALTVGLAAGLLGSVTWSTDSHACAAEPLLSSVCIMAMPTPGRTMSGFTLAWGQQLQVSQNAALYSLIGNTFGGSGNTSFNVPDLRGRVVVGGGTFTDSFGPQTYQAGQVGGVRMTVLSLSQLPQHNHTLVGTTVDISKMTATTTLSGLTTTTNLANIPFTSSSSSLSIKASNATAASANPSTSSSLATLNAGLSAKLYGTGVPDTTMQVGTVVGTVSGTLGGTAPGTVSGGTAATTLGGTASISGSTAIAGSSAAVPLMQPYLVMNYYIATQGLYPNFE